ncbi:MAG: ABC transporter permease, partial [Bacteroidetes bacterium]|nr:ABC transporter permease [Bacteroidota bacterium]
FLFIQYERSYDGFHRHSDRLYRIGITHRKGMAVTGEGAEFTPPIGPAMKEEFAEVEEYVRVSTPRPVSLDAVGKQTGIGKAVFADSTFFTVFDFVLTHGDPRQALAAPFSLVLTETEAARIFGEENPLGKTVTIDNSGVYTVTGVAKDPPANSDVQFEALLSFSTLYRIPGLYLDWNGGNQYITYVLLGEHIDLPRLEAKFPALLWKHINKELSGLGVSIEARLHPIADLRLYHNPGSGALRTNLVVAGAVALLILFIACVNFVNLTTSQALPRAREVGIRKVLGASRGGIIAQFLAESLVVSAVAALLALFFVDLVVGEVGSFMGQPLTVSSLLSPASLAIAVGVILTVAIAGGIYPAMALSSISPAESLKGGGVLLRSAARNVLVTLQFAVAIGLGSATLVVAEQLHFVKSKELGFHKDQVLVLPLLGDESQRKCDVLKSAFATIPGVEGVTASSEVPHNGFTSNGYFPEGSTSPMMIHVVDVDDDFFKVYGLEIVRGRGFVRNLPADGNAILINETLFRALGWEEPLQKFMRRGGDHPIIGVVKDFHFAALHDRIEPLIMTRKPWADRFSVLSVRMNTADVRGTVAAVREAWIRIVPLNAFSYYFLDEAYDQVYRREERFQTMLYWGSGLAMVIATIGLLSLVALSVRQRTKEIGIRKVLGSSSGGIVVLMAKDYTKLLGGANLIAWPAAGYFIERWLERFAYHITLPWWTFLAAGGVAALIALTAVSLQSLRAALANPVKSLRYE